MKKKVMTKKTLIILLCCLFAVIIFIPQMPVFANAGEITGIGETTDIVDNKYVADKEAAEREKTIVSEENFSVKAEKDEFEISIIENELTKNNTSVEVELNKQIEMYEDMLAVETNEETLGKIQSLIDTVRQLAAVNLNENTYYEISTNSAVSNVHFQNISYVNAYFMMCGYELSSELLIRSIIDNPTTYVPVYGSRVIASQSFWNIANGTETLGSVEFQNTGSSYEKDLYNALHFVDFNKVGKTITIGDTYDYLTNEERAAGKVHPSDEYAGAAGVATGWMKDAELAGVLIPYPVAIPIDTSEILRTKIVSKSNNVWTIDVTNPKNYELEVVYNMKMCNGWDAKEWKGLTDIATIDIPANGTKRVTVLENGTSWCIAFSYIIGSVRYVSYSHGLDAKGYSNPDIIKTPYTYYDNIGIVGKNGKTWIIKVTNTYSSNRVVQYNYKMCNENDAKNWTGLNHILITETISSGKSKNIIIEENWFATHIAVSFVSNNARIIRYANSLNANCTMSVNTMSFSGFSNAGKSGSAWKIKITNPFNYQITATYNSKMCSEGNAKNWTGLNANDQINITLTANQTKEVTISENWFATHIVVSYVSGSKRYISYANELNTNGGINVGYNVV